MQLKVGENQLRPFAIKDGTTTKCLGPIKHRNSKKGEEALRRKR